MKTKVSLRVALAAFAGLILLWNMGQATAQTPLAVDITSVDDEGAPVVRTVVNVLDATHRPIRDLTADNFKAVVNGETATVTDVRTAVNSDIGMAVVIVVDVSGSMEGEPLQQAQAAARSFVEGLAPADSAAILTFSDSVNTVQGFTTDRTKLLAAIDGLRISGNTALYQAASVAADQAATSPAQRRAIVLLSDGLDYGGKSTVSRDESIARARGVGVPVFAVGLGTEIDRQYLALLAGATSGRFLETPTPEGLSDLFRSIGDFLRSQYVVTVNAPDLDRSESLTFKLEVRSGEVAGSGTFHLPPRVEAPPVVPPTVSLVGLTAGAEIEEPVALSAQVQTEEELQSVTFLVDGVEVYTFTSPPYMLNLDPQAYGAGPHSLRVEARDTGGRLGTADVTFTSIVPVPSEPARVRPIPLAAAGLLILAAALIFVLGRRRQKLSVSSIENRVKPWSGRPGSERQEFTWPASQPVKLEDRALGFIVASNGPQSGKTFDVGDRPRRIGSAPYCDIVLNAEGADVAPEEARAWVSGGRLIVHRLPRAGSIGLESAAEEWLFLEPDDELSVGSMRFVFTLADETVEAAPQPQAVVRPLGSQTEPWGSTPS